MESNEENKEAKTIVYLDKVGLVPSSTEKLDAWISYVEERKQGTKLTKRGLVNWLIEQLPAQPSKSDANLLVEKFYDEERHLKQRIRQVRARKMNQATSCEETLEAEDPETSA